MNQEEKESEMWGNYHGNPIVLVLEDGTKIFPSQDPEGNGPGCLFGENPNGDKIRIQ